MGEDPSFGGSCHCCAVSVVYRTAHAADTMPLRACGCSFCRRHGARVSTDPEGSLEIVECPPGLARYRFGLKTADFLICRGCGVYVAAVCEIDGALYATLNVNTLDIRDTLDPAPPIVHYDGEDASGRIARRAARWTPARLSAGDG